MKTLLHVACIPRHIRSDIVDSITDRNLPASIEHLTVTEAMDAWLRWNGIIGWTEQILEAVRALDLAEQVQRQQNIINERRIAQRRQS